MNKHLSDAGHDKNASHLFLDTILCGRREPYFTIRETGLKKVK